MQIETNKNIDDYKDDFFKGLTLQQTVAAVAVLISAGGSFAVFYMVLGLPMSISIYAALPFSLPFAAAGFLKIHGISPYVYMKKKRAVQTHPVFVRNPEYLQEAVKKQQKDPELQEKRSPEKVLLVTEEESFLRDRQYTALVKREGGRSYGG